MFLRGLLFLGAPLLAAWAPPAESTSGTCAYYLASSIRLEAAEVNELLKSFQDVDVANRKRVLDRLVRAHSELVIFLAKRWHTRNRDIDLDDLVQVGMTGIEEAAKRFDPSKGTFKNYVWQWIKERITSELEERRAENGGLVRSEFGLKYFYKKRQIHAALESRGIAVTAETIAEYYNTHFARGNTVTVQQVEAAELGYFRSRLVAIDAPVGTRTVSLVASGKSPEEQVILCREVARCESWIEEFLEPLNGMEKATFLERILPEWMGQKEDVVTLQMLGDRFGCSRENMRLIHNKVLRKFAHFQKFKLALAPLDRSEQSPGE